MALSRKTENLIVLLIYVVIAIVFFFQDKCYVPSSDDMFYKFVCNDLNGGYIASDIGDGTQYIETISDINRSMSWFYTHVNGRYLVHYTIQACTAFLPANFFSAINALFYMVFLMLLCRLCIRNHLTAFTCKVIIIIALAWFLIPFQGTTFLGGIATAVNYLWTAVFFLSFIIVFNNINSIDTNIQFLGKLLLTLFGIFVGSLQESFSIGLSGALFVYLLFKWHKINMSGKLLLLGLFIGTAICVLSPGNFVRLSSQETDISKSSFFLGSLTSWAIDVFLLSVILIGFVDYNYLKSSFKDNIILIGVIFFNSIFCIFIAYNGRHQLICNSVCSLIITVRLWANYKIRGVAFYKVTATVLLIAMIAHHIYIYNIRIQRHSAFLEICEKALERPSNHYVSCRKYEDINWYLANCPLTCYYYVGLNTFVGVSGMKKALSLTLSKGNNIHLLDNLYPDEPAIIAKMCTKDNCVAENTYRIFDNYYIIKTNDNIINTNIAVSAVIKRRAFFLSDTNENIHPQEKFKYKGQYYYILGNRDNLEPIIAINNIKIE